MIDLKTKKILSTAFCKGKIHDFKLFKESRIFCDILHKILADSGYQGILAIHKNSEIPQKNTKKTPLTKEQKQKNKKLSSKRIFVENVIASVKRFRILKHTYRNRRKRFYLRFNLISAIHNFEL